MSLKAIEVRKDPLDYSSYKKPSKKVEAETKFLRLKTSFINKEITLNDYLYSLASNIEVFSYNGNYLVDSVENDLMDEIEAEISAFEIDKNRLNN